MESLAWSQVHRVGSQTALVVEGGLFATYSFPGCTDPRNNHTEAVLMKSLLGPLALASYPLTLTSEFNPFLLICVSPCGSGLLAKFRCLCLSGLHGFSLTPPSFSQNSV